MKYNLAVEIPIKVVELVVPVHNEASSLEVFFKAFLNFMDQNSGQSNFKILFIDDGSTDETPIILENFMTKHTFVKVLTFARNYGKEAALFAGITKSTGDAVIPMDVDLQDPFEVIPKFIEHWNSGSKMVVGKRVDRSDESILKRWTAQIFYSSYNKFADVSIPANVGDFRLLDKEIIERVSKINEHNKFMKGIYAYAGKVDAEIPYIRSKGIRTQDNKPTQTFNKLLKLAEEAFSGAGTRFFRNIFYITLILDLFLLLYTAFIFYQKIKNDVPFQGFASITMLIALASSIQITLISFIGIIASKILSEAKQRPSYFLKNTTIPE
jgi:glycosyltransferase involved in cell wall biosynthesis